MWGKSPELPSDKLLAKLASKLAKEGRFEDLFMIVETVTGGGGSSRLKAMEFTALLNIDLVSKGLPQDLQTCLKNLEDSEMETCFSNGIWFIDVQLMLNRAPGYHKQKKFMDIRSIALSDTEKRRQQQVKHDPRLPQE